jgi:hypothetical protein
MHAGNGDSEAQADRQENQNQPNQDIRKAAFVMLHWRLTHPFGTFQAFRNGDINDWSNGNVTDRNFEDLFTSDPRLKHQATNWQKGLTMDQVFWVKNNLHLFKSRWRARFINPPPKPTEHPAILARARMNKPDDDADANSSVNTQVQAAN